MEALRYLHDLHIVHRDLKPRNILIKQGVIKLSDMSNAELLSQKRMDQSGSIGLLTHIDLPPEVLNDINKYNEKSDIWAAGVLFHQMLSQGKHPFDPIGTNQTDEIVENIKSKNRKFDECIRDPKCLAILESTFIIFVGIYFEFLNRLPQFR